MATVAHNATHCSLTIKAENSYISHDVKLLRNIKYCKTATFFKAQELTCLCFPLHFSMCIHSAIINHSTAMCFVCIAHLRSYYSVLTESRNMMRCSSSFIHVWLWCKILSNAVNVMLLFTCQQSVLFLSFNVEQRLC